MNELIKKAVEEYKQAVANDDFMGSKVQQFRRKIYMAQTAGVITADELHEIFNAIDDVRHEMMKSDMMKIEKLAQRRFR